MSLQLIQPREILISESAPAKFYKTNTYYLGRGRNAWNSTWSNVYYQDCFSFNDYELRGTAEKQRKQGSVFNITSLPMLVASYKTNSFGMRPVNDRSAYEYNMLLNKMRLNPANAFWHHLPGSDMNWIIVLCLGSDKEFMNKRHEFSYKSWSSGSKYT